MLSYIPSVSILLRAFVFFLVIMDVEIYQMLFCLLRRSCGFCLLIFICCITLICVCWTILVNLEWIPLGCGIWCFCVVGLVWWYFVENFCTYIQIYWPVIFYFWWCLCLVLVSEWGWLNRMSLGVPPPLQFFERVWEELV